MLKLIDEVKDEKSYEKLFEAWNNEDIEEDIETNVIDFETIRKVSFDNFSSDYVFADDYIYEF